MINLNSVGIIADVIGVLLLAISDVRLTARPTASMVSGYFFVPQSLLHRCFRPPSRSIRCGAYEEDQSFEAKVTWVSRIGWAFLLSGLTLQMVAAMS